MAENAEKSLAGPAHNANVDDESLVKRFKRGDDSAFETIVDQYSADIAALANRLLGWPGDVEDVTQSIFLAAFLGLKKFRCECSLRTWLFTITISKCRTCRHKLTLRRRLLSNVTNHASPLQANPADKRPMDRETSDRVRRAVTTLPPKYREPVVLTYLQQLPADQVAEMLGISRSNLQVRLSRARERLREDLAELMEQ